MGELVRSPGSSHSRAASSSGTRILRPGARTGGTVFHSICNRPHAVSPSVGAAHRHLLSGLRARFMPRHPVMTHESCCPTTLNALRNWQVDPSPWCSSTPARAIQHRLRGRAVLCLRGRIHDSGKFSSSIVCAAVIPQPKPSCVRCTQSAPLRIPSTRRSPHTARCGYTPRMRNAYIRPHDRRAHSPPLFAREWRSATRRIARDLHRVQGGRIHIGAERRTETDDPGRTGCRRDAALDNR